MDKELRLHPEALAAARAYWRAKDYAAMYRVIARDLRSLGADHDTQVWYDLAAGINDPKSESFRGALGRYYVMEKLFQETGRLIAPFGDDFNRVSDEIAWKVGKYAYEHDGLVRTWPEIMQRDALAATEGFHSSPEVWPGFADAELLDWWPKSLFPRSFDDHSFAADLPPATATEVGRAGLNAFFDEVEAPAWGPLRFYIEVGRLAAQGLYSTWRGDFRGHDGDWLGTGKLYWQELGKELERPWHWGDDVPPAPGPLGGDLLLHGAGSRLSLMAAPDSHSGPAPSVAASFAADRARTALALPGSFEPDLAMRGSWIWPDAAAPATPPAPPFAADASPLLALPYLPEMRDGLELRHLALPPAWGSGHLFPELSFLPARAAADGFDPEPGDVPHWPAADEFVPDGEASLHGDGPPPQGETGEDGRRLERVEGGIGRIEQSLAEVVAKLEASYARRERLGRREIIRVVSEWLEYQANKPRNMSWRYDFRRTYTPPGPVPAM